MSSGRQKKTKQKQSPLLFPLAVLMLIPLKNLILYFLIIIVIDQSKDTLKRKLHKISKTQHNTFEVKVFEQMP